MKSSHPQYYPRTSFTELFRLARRGFTILELIVSLILLGMMISAVVPVMAMVSSQRRIADQREMATQEAANLMEQVTVLPWDEIVPSLGETLNLRPETVKHLPEAGLDVEIKSADDSPERKQITIHLDWNDRSGNRVEPVRLTTFVYSREGP